VFNNIKQKVATSPIFTNPVKGKPFHLCPDASDYAVGAALEHEGKDGQWHVVAYGRCSLTNAERKWSSTEKECFAVVHFMNLWQNLLLGVQLEVLTDHQVLSKIFGQAESPKGKLARWVSKMKPFKPFNVRCWSGSNSDALSRELKTGQVATICKGVEQWVKSCRTELLSDEGPEFVAELNHELSRQLSSIPIIIMTRNLDASTCNSG